MQVRTDRITNILGIIGGILIIQQTYWPEKLPKEYVAPILASIVSTYGMVGNRRKIIISFNGHEHDEVDKLEAEIERKRQEIEELVERKEKASKSKHGRHEDEY